MDPKRASRLSRPSVGIEVDGPPTVALDKAPSAPQSPNVSAAPRRRGSSPLADSTSYLGIGGGTITTTADRRQRQPSTSSAIGGGSLQRAFLPQPVETIHAAQVERYRALILEPMFWSLRTLYSAPLTSSSSQCVLQNDFLTRFGGLGQECADLMFIVITKACALRPSSCQLYLRECEKLRVMPIPAILNQLYTTPGRYSLHELTFSGHPLGLMGARVIAPVIAANVGLTSIALRGCNLSDGSALHELLWVMEKHAQLESLDLSCNRLSDENGHAEALLEFISIHPMLLHIGLGKNELSGESIHKIRVALAARSDSPPPTVSVPGEALAHRSLPLLPATEGSHGGVGHRKEVGGGGALLHLPSGGASPHSNRNGSSPPKPTRPDQQPAKSPAPRSSPRYADTQARVDSCRHGGNRRRRANSPQAPQTLTLVGVDSIEVSVPVISQSKFFAAVNIFVSLMARQLGMLEMSVFATMLPHAFEVYRKQCGSTNAEYVTLLQYLEATFPFCGRKRMLHTLKAFSQYSLIAPVRRPTKETLRVDQRDEIDLIFKTLDKEGQGVLPTSVLNHPNATCEETLETDAMLERLGITQLNSEALAVLMAPYIVEIRKRKRFR